MPRTSDQISDAQLRIVLASGLGPVTYRRLLERFGSAESIVDAPAIAFESVKGIGVDTARALRSALDEADSDAERALMEQHETRLIVHGDPDYPALLAAISDPPIALWIRGEFTEADRLGIAIVGSRNCTAYGREQASRFASLLAQSGLTVVSGGALGIDGAAHRATLRVKGRTIVVQGCGLSRSYPKDHEELFERVVRENAGAIISEHPMGAPPIGKHFPKRNRIIVGLSLGVLVIEAAMRSGALITARLASEENREVMALPGRVDSPASAGSLKVLRDGGAAMVLDHTDVVRQLDSAGNMLLGAIEAVGTPTTTEVKSLFDVNLNDAQKAIVEALTATDDSLLVDQIAARTQIPMSRLMSELTLLQIRGHIHKDHRGVRLRRVAQAGE